MEKEKWTIEKLKAYLFIYCANADFIESKQEDELIISKVGKEVFESTHLEYNQDSDYDKVLKIEQGVKDNHLSKEELKSLISEITDIFRADHKIDTLEENLFRGLKHILF